MMENNSGTRRVYNVQMMAQQAQALDALQKVSQLEKAMEPDHPNGRQENPMPDLTVGHTEVYVHQNTPSYNADDAREIG